MNLYMVEYSVEQGTLTYGKPYEVINRNLAQLTQCGHVIGDWVVVAIVSENELPQTLEKLKRILQAVR